MTVKSSKLSQAYGCVAFKCGAYFAGSLITTPLQRILEAVVCKGHHTSLKPEDLDVYGNVAEHLCKQADTQQEISNILALFSVLTLVFALPAALLYMALLPHLDRKRLLLLNLGGVIMMELWYSGVLYFNNLFNPRWIFLTGFFCFVGGGFPIFNGLIPAIMADSVPQSQLSTFQLYTTAASLLVKLVGTSISLSIMKISLWLPVVLAFMVYGVLVFVLLTIFGFSSSPVDPDAAPVRPFPEDQHGEHKDDNEDDHDPSWSYGNAGIFEMLNFASGSEHARPARPRRKVAQLLSLLNEFVRSYKPVLGPNLLPIAIVGVIAVGHSSRVIMPYWMSRRYNWELREVGWVQLGESLFTALTVMVLPKVMKRWTRQSSRAVPPFTRSDPAREPDLEHLPPAFADSDNDDDHDGSDTATDKDLRRRYSRASASTAHPRLSNQSDDSDDLSLAGLCVLLAAVGNVLLGFSWHRVSALTSLAVLAGGAGFQDLYFSYLAGQARSATSTSTTTEPDQTAVYAVLSMAMLLAAGLGSWLVSGLYSLVLGLGRNSYETSVPMWVCGAVLVLAYRLLQRHRR